jgi:uncharacterized protein (DUF58 family)
VTAHARAPAAAKGGGQFLDPAVLARISNLELLARTVVDGFLTGLHRSPYLGFSMDFAEHRQYMPGDDIRRIDWKLFARSDRHYIKLFEADTNTNFAVLLDVSKSMSYGSHEVSKLDYARYLAACLTFFSHRREGSLYEPSIQIAELLSRKGIIVVISDFYEEPDTIIKAIGPLRARGHDVIVFHVLDPAELEFPFEEASGFEDLETGEQIPVIPNRLKDDYIRLVTSHLEEIERRFTDHRIDYTLLDTSKPLDLALFQYLLARERLSRKR